jgi:PAS domain S-box-containing protein
MLLFQYTLFMLLAPLAAVLMLVVIGYAWKHRAAPGALPLVWLSADITGWLTFSALELADPLDMGALFWARLAYPFIASVPVTWLVFALHYTGRDQWQRPARQGLARQSLARLALLSLIPLTTAAMALTNDAHHWLWASYTFTSVGPWTAMSVTYGPWFRVHAVYSYTLILLGTLVIGVEYFRASKLYRRQSVWVLAGALGPLVFNVVYVFRLIPGFVKDYSPVSFALAGLSFAIGMFRYRLFDLKPVARDTLVESMSDGMIVLDEQDRIVDFNPAAQDILGIPMSTAIGQFAGQVLSPWQDLVDRFWDKRMAQAEIELEREGRKRCYDLRISPLDDRRGHVGRLIVLRDMTERKHAEQALQQANLELQARNQDLDTFGHTVAHDLKGPLGTLIGYSEFLADNPTGVSVNDLRRCARNMLQVSRKMNNIIEELMLLSGLHKMHVEMKPLDMGRIFSDAHQRLAHLLGNQAAQIAWPDDWPAAMGHGPWVEEVWVNYLSNAIKYGGQPPQIQVGATSVTAPDAGSRMIRFWVRDNGPGISPEVQSRLFAPFERFDQARATGYGVGLSIVRQIVEKMGGQASVESAGVAGQGSTFSFTLPAAEHTLHG